MRINVDYGGAEARSVFQDRKLNTSDISPIILLDIGNFEGNGASSGNGRHAIKCDIAVGGGGLRGSIGASGPCNQIAFDIGICYYIGAIHQTGIVWSDGVGSELPAHVGVGTGELKAEEMYVSIVVEDLVGSDE